MNFALLLAMPVYRMTSALRLSDNAEGLDYGSRAPSN